MIITTTENIPNKKIESILGLVRGNTVMSRNIGVDIAASFKAVVGGEIKGFQELLIKSRETAIERMISEAEKLGADAVVMVRLTTSEIMKGTAEILAYGTAVKLAK